MASFILTRQYARPSIYRMLEFLQRSAPPVGYLAAALIAWVAVASWYSPGRFVAAGDIGPFIRDGLGQDLGTAWGYGISGVGTLTAEVARFPEYGIYQLVTSLGGSPIVAQQLFYFLVLFFGAAGAVAAIRQHVDLPAAHVAVAILAVMNPLLSVFLPNPLIPVAVGTLGVLWACLVRAARGEGSVIRTVLATMPLSWLSINPPTLAVVSACILVAAVVMVLASRDARPHLMRHALVAAPVVLAANLWWIVPSILLYTSVNTSGFAAVTEPDDWAWTHVNNSVPKVTTLTAFFGWGIPEYLPFSDNLDRGPLSMTRWGLPLLLLLSPLLARSRQARRLSIGALAVAAICILVGKGLHGPLSDLNRQLYRLPGMWLLREPMSKVGPVLLLAYLLGAAITIEAVVERLRNPIRTQRIRAAGAAVALLTAAAMIFGMPVVTGQVAPQDRLPLPPSRVEIPDGWWELAADVNDDPIEGKALVLPALPYYQATTTWGYHGVASLPRDLLTRPTLLNLPGGYYTAPEIVGALVAVVEHNRSPQVMARALDVLGVSHVVVRRDLSDAQAAKPVARTDDLVARLDRSGLFETSTDHGVAQLYRVRDARTTPSTYHPVTSPIDPGSRTVAAITAIDRSEAIVSDANRARSTSAVLATHLDAARTELAVGDSGEYQLDIGASSGRSFVVAVSAGLVSLSDPTELTVEGREPIHLNGLTLWAASEERPLALSISGRVTPISDRSTIDLAADAEVAAISADDTPVPVRGWGPVGDCDNRDDAEPDLKAKRRGTEVRLSASDHAACVNTYLPISGPSVVQLQVEVHSGQGRLCAWSDAANACLHDMTYGGGSGPTDVTLPLGSSDPVRLFLYADAEANDEPAEVSYHAVRMRRLVIGDPVTVLSAVHSDQIELGAGDNVAVANPGATGDGRLGPPSKLGNCNDLGDDPPLDLSWDGRTIELTAMGGGSACIFRSVSPVYPGIPYEVAFDYRTSGRFGRWCLWLDEERRCANDEQVLPATTSWKQHRSTVVLGDDTTRARLFFYADSNNLGPSAGTQPVTAAYRDAVVQPSLPLTVSLEGEAVAPVPAVRQARGGGDRWEVDLDVSDSSFLLALPDSRHDGWRLRGLPAGASAEPVTVDGFRQGWLVDGVVPTPLTVVAQFEPARWARYAVGVSVATLVLVLGWAALPRGLRRRLR